MEGVSKICLFVDNLPYAFSDSGLEQVFSQYGALRSCYTVKDNGPSKRCRGFGYVIYVNSEDAQKAKSQVKLVGGRPVQLTFAIRKSIQKSKKNSAVSHGEAVEGGEEEEEEEEDYEALTAKENPVKKSHKSKSERASAKFNVGQIITIKNLPNTAKEKKIRSKCEKFGSIDMISFPVSRDKDKETLEAHVTFTNHKAARLAMKELNGAKFGKKSASVMNVSLLSRENKPINKKTLKKSRLIVRNLSFKATEADVQKVFEKYGHVVQVHIPHKESGQMLGYCFVQYDSYFNASNALAHMDKTEIKGRQITVDWLLPKDEYKKMESGDDKNSSRASLERNNEVNEGGMECEEDGSDGLEEDHDGGSEVENDGETDELGEEESDEEISIMSVEDTVGDKCKKNHVSKVYDDVTEGKTIFIRNLPFDADNQTIKKLMMKFGVVRYCRVMMNKETSVATGSAFVQFKTSLAVQKCLRTAESEGGVVCNGQQLNISVALPRDKIKREGLEKEDKRNLYLAKEGAIFPDSEAAKDLSKSDMAKRMKAYAEKKAKLAKSHCYVSKTRLCVRNIPTYVDERRLKALFQSKAADSNAKVIQVKILRSTERVDSKGLGRSKGYGFVEFSDHESALSALRSTNNNPSIFGNTKRLIVDFAVEDSRVMKIREHRKKKRESLQKGIMATAATGTGASSDDNPVPNSRLTKRRKWQMKWKLKREKRKENKVLQNNNKQESREDNTSAKLISKRTDKRKQTRSEDQDHFSRRKRLKQDGVAGVRTLSSIKRGKEISRKKKKLHNDTEEVNFVKMVEKYRQKLAKQAT